MAIDDNTSYELTGAQVKDLANKIKAKAADNIFVGATSAAPGSKGLVPAPQGGDDTKFLSGDGTWKSVSGSTPTMLYLRNTGVVNTTGFYSDSAFTTKLTGTQVLSYVQAGNVQVVASVMSMTTSYFTIVEYDKKVTGSDWPVFYLSGPEGDIIVKYTTSSMNLATVTEKKYKSGFSADSYSTSEVDTQTTWVDGSKIYKKTINFGALPDSTIKSVAHSISNLGYVVKIEGTAVANSTWIPLPLVYSSTNAAYNVEVTVSTTDVVCNTTQDRSMFSAYITLYYTKSS